MSGSGRSPGEGNGNPLQYSCLGNATVRGAWWTAVHGVTKNQTEHTRSYICKPASYSYLRLLTTQVFKLQTWVPFLTLYIPLIREMSTLVSRICFKILQQRGISVWENETDKYGQPLNLGYTCHCTIPPILFVSVTGTTLSKMVFLSSDPPTLNSNSKLNSSAILLNNLVALKDFYRLCPKSVGQSPNCSDIQIFSTFCYNLFPVVTVCSSYTWLTNTQAPLSFLLI